MKPKTPALLGRAGVLEALAARREGRPVFGSPAPARERMARRPAVKRILRDYPFLHRWDASRYPVSYLRLGLSEEQVQEVVVGYLRGKFLAEVTVIDSGDRRLRGRAAKLLADAGGDPGSLVGRGGTIERGVVDLAVTFRNGRAGWFELKRPEHLVASAATGKLIQGHAAGGATVEQLNFLERHHRHHAIVGVLWGTIDVDAVVPEELSRSTPARLVSLEDDLAYGAHTDGGKDLTKGPA